MICFFKHKRKENIQFSVAKEESYPVIMHVFEYTWNYTRNESLWNFIYTCWQEGSRIRIKRNFADDEHS